MKALWARHCVVCFRALFLLILQQSHFTDEKVESREVKQLVIRGAGVAALEPELLTAALDKESSD